MNNSKRLPRSRRRLGILLAATTALLVAAAVAIAAPGDLDPTFGQGGIVTTPFDSDPARAAFGMGVALQPDGQKIVAAGWRYRQNQTTSSGIALARYTLNGSLDPTFSGDGVYANDNIAESGQYFDAVVLADNSIWATGRIDDYAFFDPPGGTDCWVVFGRPVVAHYASNGTLLTQSTALWQNGGQRVLGCPQPLVGYATWYFRAIAVQPDGKIVAAGYRSDDRPAPDFVVVRFTPTGALDTAFGSGGVVTLDMSGGTDFGRAVVLQPDGKIIVGGVSEGTPLVQALSIARLNPDGTLDSTFGTAGKLFVDGAAAYALRLQPDGKIVAAGRVNGSEFGVSRFTANGTPDPGFGTNGAASGVGAGWAFGEALQPNGKIVGVGQGINGPYSIVRWNADGTLDGTFGVGGTVVTPFVIQSPAYLPYADAAVQPDGKLVALASDGYGFALARYLGDPAVAPKTTSTTYTGSSNIQYSDPLTLSGTLLDTSVFPNVGVAGRQLGFTVGTQVASASPTDGSGSASTSIVVTQKPGTVTTVQTSFAGDSSYLGSNDSDAFAIAKEDCTLTYSGDTLVSPASTTNLAADLGEPDTSLGDRSNKSITFTVVDAALNTQTFTATTDSSGHGSVAAALADGVYAVSVSFAGDDFYLPCTTPAETLVTIQTAGARVGGAGWIAIGTGKTFFGFNAIPQAGGMFKGQFQLRSNNGKDRFRGNVVSSLSGTGNTATWTGTGSWNGQPAYTYTISVVDNGSGSKKGDTISITITSPGNVVVYTTGGPQTLKGGNITVH